MTMTPPPPVPPPSVPPPPEPEKEKEKEKTGPVSGWIPGQGFVVRSADEESYKLRVGLQAAYRASVTIDKSDTQFRNPFFALRPVLAGNLYKKWITFYTTLELNTNPPYLNDSLVQIQPWDEFGLVVGQQYTPYSRHEYLYGPTQLLFTDWNIVADYFWTGRDKGITFQGSCADHHLDWWVGGYLGAPLRQFDVIQGNYSFIARLALNPQGATGNTEFAYAENAEKDEPAPLRTSFSIQGYTNRIQPGTQNFNSSSFKFVTEPTPGVAAAVNHGAGIDGYLQSSNVMAMAEGYYRRTEPHSGVPDYSSVGAFAQVGVLVYERLVDVALRGTWADVNVTGGHSGEGRFLGGEIGGTWYVRAPVLAVKLRYGYADQKGPSDGTSKLAGAALIIPEGQVHVVTAQLNVTF
jgi:hypothetical protein